MADERSHAIRFHLEPNQLVISSQNAEEGEAVKRYRRITLARSGHRIQRTVPTRFLNVMGGSRSLSSSKTETLKHNFALLRAEILSTKYVVMPMRIFQALAIGFKEALP